MLTEEQVQQFREDGYLVFESLIQGERLAYYKQVFDELVAEGRKLTEQVPHWTLELDERDSLGRVCCTKFRAFAWLIPACYHWHVSRRF